MLFKGHDPGKDVADPRTNTLSQFTDQDICSDDYSEHIPASNQLQSMSPYK